MTKIEWTDETWNPTRGCSPVSPGCKHCYAERQAARNLPSSRSPITGEAFAIINGSGPHWTGKVELIESKLTEPLPWKKPRRVFVNSMSDLFHENLSDEAIDWVFAVMALCPQHTFQVLTKRADRMREYFKGDGLDLAVGIKTEASKIPGYHERLCEAANFMPWPYRNIWLGVSVEDQATADERIPKLLQTPAAVRFVSYEPALDGVDFEAYIGKTKHCCLRCGWRPIQGMDGYLQIHGETATCLQCHDTLPNRTLDWIIVGGESGPGARPFDIEWAREIIRQCKAAGVPVFVKQLGANPIYEAQFRPYSGVPVIDKKILELYDSKGGNWDEWPSDLRIREFPR